MTNDFSFFDNFDDAIIKLDFLKVKNSNKTAKSLGFFEGNEILDVFTSNKIDEITRWIISNESFKIEDKFYFFQLTDERFVRIRYFQSYLFIKDLTEKVKVKEAKVNFTTSISHELFTPLSALKGNLYFLRENISDKFTLEVLNQMEKSVRRMERIIRQLKIISMLELGMYEPKNDIIDVEKLINEVLDEFSEKIESKKLKFSVEFKIDEVKFDSFMLYTIIKNIVSNAIKYSYEESTIYIIVDKESITVKDNGIGIKKEDIKKVTERFYRSKNAIKMAPGSGLGLSIVKHICNILGCKLDIKSDYLIGTEVKIYY
ncbi:histidine kinase [Thermosipho melanesiensis]|nr:histidine kinase [Thermosipho melanesiensis]OOC35463.1 histidine kinase [Thermosipho melanesiensis]OOC36821.1 histidine kinase [Thermosipho melanesiensis]OOC40035.1 histidine kinase [Thermosipho melanesiensis]OOC41883.1 histidine kinase [Thermosipho melanesiensis]